MTGRPDPELRLVRRAERVLTVQTAAVIMLGMLLVGVVALAVLTREQRAAAESGLRSVAATAEDADDPPPGMWIFLRDAAGRLTSGPGAPAGLPDRADLERVRAGGSPRVREITAGGETYLVLTVRRGPAIVQVAAGLEHAEQERERLLAALAVAEAVGLILAVVLGMLLARRATAPLGEALTRQRRFVADASHELRTPLTQLHTRAQLLARDLRAGADRSAVTTDADQLVSGTRQLGEVVEDLLLSSHLDGRAGERLPVDLGVVAAGVLGGLRLRAADRQVALELVPAPDRPAIVDGHEAALRRVLTALVDNAISHTSPGGHVVVELNTSAGGVTVVVRDDGEGFDPAAAEHIFDRFARAGASDRRRFGLGLALAREVVTGHGGTIEGRGRPGEGATFTVRLPAPR